MSQLVNLLVKYDTHQWPFLQRNDVVVSNLPVSLMISVKGRRYEAIASEVLFVVFLPDVKLRSHIACSLGRTSNFSKRSVFEGKFSTVQGKMFCE